MKHQSVIVYKDFSKSHGLILILGFLKRLASCCSVLSIHSLLLRYTVISACGQCCEIKKTLVIAVL